MMRLSMLRQVRRVASALALVMLSLVCASAAEMAPLNPPVKVRMNSAGIAGEGGLFLALDKGYFKAEGVDIELVAGAATNAGMDTVAQIVAGELDIATLAPGAGLFNALARNIGLTGLFAVNTVGKDDRSNGLVVRQDHIASGRYKSPKDLKGMKIAVLTLGGTGHYNAVRALELAGLTDGDADFATMPFPDALVALGNKVIDAAFEVEPFISAAKARNIGSLAVPGSETSLGAPTIMLYANKAFAQKNAEAVRRLLYALMRGERDYNAARTSGAGIEDLYSALQKYTALKDPARIKDIALPTTDAEGKFEPAAIDDLQKFFVRTKTMQKPLPIGQIVDRSYADAAAARLMATSSK